VLATGAGDGVVRLWSISGRRQLETFSGPKDLGTLAFSPDGRLLAAATGNGAVVWDVASRRKLAAFRGHVPGTLAIAFSPDGRALAAAAIDAVHLWNLRTHAGTTLGTRSANALAFSPDGRTLAVAPANGPLELWNVRAPASAPRLLPSLGDASTVAFSKAGGLLAVADPAGKITLVDAATLQPLPVLLVGHTDNVNSLAFNPAGTLLASASDDGTAILWDASRDPRAVQLAGPGVQATSVSTATNGLTAVARGSSVFVWPTPTSRPVNIGVAGPLLDVSMSDDGKTVAAGAQNGQVYVGASTGPLRRVAFSDPNVSEPVVAVALRPDGSQVAEALNNAQIRLQRTADTAFGPALPNTAHPAFALDLAFSPDGHTLAAGREDGSVALWDVDRRRLLGSFRTSDSLVRSIAFSPDGSVLATASGTTVVRLWSVRSRTPFGEPLRAADPVTTVRFAPEGRLIAAGTTRGAIVLFDVAARQQLGAPLQGHKGQVFSLAFGRGGTSVVSAGMDGRVLLWNVDDWASDDALRDRACSLVGRNLTRSEWSTFLPGKAYGRTCPQWPAGP
jgi:WD40 repeat protein